MSNSHKVKVFVVRVLHNIGWLVVSFQVHKLISTSTFLMFPGHQFPVLYPPPPSSISSTRVFSQQKSQPSDYPVGVKNSAVGGCGGSYRNNESYEKENKFNNGPSYIVNSIASPQKSRENSSNIPPTLKDSCAGNAFDCAGLFLILEIVFPSKPASVCFHFTYNAQSKSCVALCWKSLSNFIMFVSLMSRTIFYFGWAI